jgi:hypothetical protein
MMLYIMVSIVRSVGRCAPPNARVQSDPDTRLRLHRPTYHHGDSLIGQTVHCASEAQLASMLSFRSCYWLVRATLSHRMGVLMSTVEKAKQKQQEEQKKKESTV